MTESSFHLTPVDVRTQEFRRVLRGYDPAGVEDFRARVADELERLLRERAALDERLQSFREQLKTFREREKALNDALVLAEKLRTETEQAAKRQAELTIQEGQAAAEQLLREARTTEVSVRRDIEAAQRQFAGYLAALRMLLERHLSEVDALEAHQRDGSPPGA